MGWRDRHPAPRRCDYDSAEEYEAAYEGWLEAEDAAAEEYVEKKMHERYDGGR